MIICYIKDGHDPHDRISQQKYEAVKGDETDQAVAKFLNDLPDKNQVIKMFCRNDKDNYTYGTKQITIIPTSADIMVNIGGKELGLYNFIEKYTEIEKQKLQLNQSMISQATSIS